ncbi:adenine deaminase [Fervidibacillus halotolerans]|uniref:Adenine deaminase n=1 Tax=Fervidibacillus halotolerans TaxID=2980027 RepID=A0A9E8RZH6_9BACI|nr:adenine deaminase [Fervidibacillus halotolerans]WAA13154.1 adenine deaminase [Fervidibacillus halotolerans]
MNKNQLRKRIQVASRQIPADLVIKNGKIIDVFNLEVIHGDIAIADGVICGIGKYVGKEVIDAESKFIVPGFIDAHVHIESSMVTPKEFAKVVLPHGITTVIIDPHEIANVTGTEGISFMLEDSENLDLDVFCMLPSSVPATPFENAGAVLNDEELKPFYNHPRVLGLAEVMDYPGVENLEDRMIDKLISASPYHIDGHGAGLDFEGINVYRAAGIQTDHECVTKEQMKDRLSRGMYVMIRQGSVAKNLPDLISVVNEKNSHRCLFCTDDKHLDDLIEEGSIDYNIRFAVKNGLDPLIAIQMASINAAQCFGLKQKGAIAPGFTADFLIIEDLKTLTIEEVYKAGKLIAKNGQYLRLDSSEQRFKFATNSIHLNSNQLTKKDLAIHVKNNQKAHVIEVIPNQIETIKRLMKVPTDGERFIPSSEKNLAKLALLERHKNTGNIGLAIVKGLGLTNGAIATTVAHDSHNLIVAGTNDEDMIYAIQKMQEIGGGLVVVKDGKPISTLPLTIGGLMSDQNYETVANQLFDVNRALFEVSKHRHFNLFLTLSFLSLPVIPELKITDLGLFDTTTFQHIKIAVDE